MTKTTSTHQSASFLDRSVDRWTIWAILTIATLCTIIGALFGSYLTLTLMSCSESCSNTAGEASLLDLNSTMPFINLKETLRIVSRSEWIAQPPEHVLAPLTLPAKHVIIAHTASEHCTTKASCKFQVRFLQTFDIESRGWDDIAYNFLIGGDGSAYVGRGWNFQGAHTRGYNAKSICITFIGTFNKIKPPKRQLDAAQNLIAEGIKMKKLSEDYILYGHRQLIKSDSPGTALYKVIKQWNHWTENIDKSLP